MSNVKSSKARRADQTALLDDDSLAAPRETSQSSSSRRAAAAKASKKEAPPPEVEEEEEEEPKSFFASKTNVIGAVVSVLVILAIIAGVAWFLLSSSAPPDSPQPVNSLWGQLLLDSVNRTRINQNFAAVTSQTSLAGTSASQAAISAVSKAFTEAFSANASITSVQLKTYPVLLSFPHGYNPSNPVTSQGLASRSLTVVAPPGVNSSSYTTLWSAGLTEDVISSDPSTNMTDAVPTFNGYSPSTPASGLIAPLFYVNYGTLADYELLDRSGFNLAGKIAIARYGGNFRGLKAAIGQQFGVVGVLIYSDPADDGYVLGDVYPKGPYRPPSGVQRGSASYMSFFAGDPLTPFVPANGSNAVYTVSNSPVLPGIPVQPISYQDAYYLLSQLNGTSIAYTGNFSFPPSWAGGFAKSNDAFPQFPGFTQRIGLVSSMDGSNPPSSPLHVNLTLAMDFNVVPITDVIATIVGKEQPDSWVVVGNHRDAWVYGAVDPHQGTAAIMELARVLGVMLQAGWQPRRSIILCSWDAEEQALIGSTEWVEDMVINMGLQAKAVAYINVGRGRHGR